MDNNEFFSTYDKSNTKRKLLTAFISLALIVLTAFLAASLINAYVTETFTVDGSSMNNTLSGGEAGNYEDGDRVVVNHFGKITRGCIVVLRLENHDNALVKRIIGVEGDRIKIEDGILFVNDVVQDEPYVAESNKIIVFPFSQMDEVTVSENCVFVMGDNRNASSDSRSFGEVPISQIAGKVFVILLEGGGFKIV